MMERKQITFDTFIRGIMAAVIIVGIVMLLNRLSGVLVPFFLAWLVSYLLFPLVKFFQYPADCTTASPPFWCRSSSLGRCSPASSG